MLACLPVLQMLWAWAHPSAYLSSVRCWHHHHCRCSIRCCHTCQQCRACPPQLLPQRQRCPDRPCPLHLQVQQQHFSTSSTSISTSCTSNASSRRSSRRSRGPLQPS
jgi:hypothetical protein